MPDPITSHAAPAFRDGAVDRADIRRLVGLLQDWRTQMGEWKSLVDSRLDQAQAAFVALRDRVVVLEMKEADLRSRMNVAESAIVDLQARVSALEAQP